MIDTAIACHTPIDALMGMSLRRFGDIRGALKRYHEKAHVARDE